MKNSHDFKLKIIWRSFIMKSSLQEIMMERSFSMQDSGNYYVINHLVQFTGLTDRTLRSYIASGVLQGEKINGMWHFTPKQVENFIGHPAVRSSILARHHSQVYDFLLDMKKKESEICVVLDIPDGNQKEIAEFFSYRINQSPQENLNFSFYYHRSHARVIVTGSPGPVMALMDAYYARQSKE